jgi:hypothetical protein
MNNYTLKLLILFLLPLSAFASRDFTETGYTEPDHAVFYTHNENGLIRCKVNLDEKNTGLNMLLGFSKDFQETLSSNERHALYIPAEIIKAAEIELGLDYKPKRPAIDVDDDDRIVNPNGNYERRRPIMIVVDDDDRIVNPNGNYERRRPIMIVVDDDDKPVNPNNDSLRIIRSAEAEIDSQDEPKPRSPANVDERPVTPGKRIL